MTLRGLDLEPDDPTRLSFRRRVTFLLGDRSLPLGPSYSPATLLSICSASHLHGKNFPENPKSSHVTGKRKSANNLLPLPPHRSNFLPAVGKHYSPKNTRKKNTSSTAMKDPFTAALVECSKGGASILDGEHIGGESNKALRKNRIWLVNLYASCRRACAVSESIVCLPRAVDGVASYDHLLFTNRRRRR
ncbi:unnamed protein product [Microthlaspi erraticum]|uniref:Uncharacterized protein n=1 Tax=Microthlaspi erraticum TaxID=1685480 RepID=A0A6D2IQ35_9BRAS|nr:unnamed protein product [Microthlaspi erraticum]